MSDILLEVIKETKIGQPIWYEVRMNGEFIYGSYTLDKAMSVFQDIKENNSPLLTREILVSEKI